MVITLWWYGIMCYTSVFYFATLDSPFTWFRYHDMFLKLGFQSQGTGKHLPSDKPSWMQASLAAAQSASSLELYTSTEGNQIWCESGYLIKK